MMDAGSRHELKNFAVDHQKLLGLIIVAFSLVLWLLFVPPRRLHSNYNSVQVIKTRFPGLGAVDYYANRYDLYDPYPRRRSSMTNPTCSLSRNVTKDSNHPHHGIAKFNLLGKIVYHVGGNDEETIRAISLNRDLSFSQGNNFLFAGIAGAKQGGLNDEGELDAEEKREMKELAKAINPTRLNNIAPRLAADAFEAIEHWLDASDGMATLDQQQTYYSLVFRFTVRVMGMAEYASSLRDLERFISAFWATQRNSGFWTTILPWIPQPRLLHRLWGAYTLWSMVRKTLAERTRTGASRKEDDYAQDLIDRGMSHNQISRFVIGGLIAGILNTIGTGAYSVAFVGADSDLQKRCREGLEAGLRRAADARADGDDYDALSLLEKLSRVRLEQWESLPEFELLHLVFRESIRLNLTNSLNRYYPGPRTQPRLRLYGHDIEDDVYIAFSPPSNLHDADAFPSPGPMKFDPTRYKRGQGLTDYTFIGWGAGHHKCTGTRFAKLETIIALSAFLLLTDIQTVVDKGKGFAKISSVDEVSLPDLSQGHWRSPTKPMRIQIKRRDTKAVDAL